MPEPGGQEDQLSGLITTSEVDLTDDETRQLVRWRFQCLRHVGYDRPAARTLARNFEADLRLAATLRKQGCPQETALRILL